MWNSIRMELYKIFRMRSFWVISIIMIGLVFMTTEFNLSLIHISEPTRH